MSRESYRELNDRESEEAFRRKQSRLSNRFGPERGEKYLRDRSLRRFTLRLAGKGEVGDSVADEALEELSNFLSNTILTLNLTSLALANTYKLVRVAKADESTPVNLAFEAGLQEFEVWNDNSCVYSADEPLPTSYSESDVRLESTNSIETTREMVVT